MLVICRLRFLLFATLSIALACGEGGTETENGSVPDPGAQISPVDILVSADLPGEIVQNNRVPSELKSVCEAPAELLVSPLTMVGQPMPATEKKHLVDVEYDAARSLILAAGIPGLAIFQDPRLEITAGQTGYLQGKYEHLQLLNGNLVALTSKGRTSKNSAQAVSGQLVLVDSTNIGSPSMVGAINLEDASGMAVRGTTIYVVGLGGQIYAVDISEPSAPSLLYEGEGLQQGWEIVLISDRGYVADNAMGIAIVDIGTGESPQVLGSVPTVTGAQDLVYHQGKLYVAVGSSGVEIFGLEEPDAPKSEGVIYVGGAVISVAAAGNLLWTANHEGVSVWDISTVPLPTQLGWKSTDSWAMHVDAIEDTVFLADWKDVQVFRIDTDLVAPVADISPSAQYFTQGVVSRAFTIRNRGAGELKILGANAGDTRISLSAEDLIVSPGAETELALVFKDDGQPLDTELCIATNDPDEPLRKLKVASTSSGSSVLIGESAPDFMLPDLQSKNYELSGQKGAPVLLCYFATW